MPALPESSHESSDTSSTYLPFPVKYAVNSAIRRFSTDPIFSSSSKSSRSQSRDPISSASSFSNLATLDASNRTPPVSQTPPPRTSRSPFQPPPLTPLSLHGQTADASQILTTQLAEEIRLLLPSRLQLSDSWRSIFSLEQNGSSLSTLFDKCDAFSGRRSGYVLVARDAGGGVFGAYLTDAPRPSNGHYYGTGECFLWRSTILSSIPTLASLPPRPSEDTTHAQRMTTIGSPTSPRSRNKRRSWNHKKQKSLDLIDFGDGNAHNDDDDFGDFKGNDDDEWGEFEGPSQASASGVYSPGPNLVSSRPVDQLGNNDGAETPNVIRFKAYPYSGENDYLIFCEQSFLSVGGGDGHYGLWLDASLENGVSENCPTFGNERLSDDGAKFEVMGVEVWYVGT